MSLQALVYVIQHAPVSGASYGVLLSIAHHYNEDRSLGFSIAYPGVALMALESRTSRRNVFRALASLSTPGADGFAEIEAVEVSPGKARRGRPITAYRMPRYESRSWPLNRRSIEVAEDGKVRSTAPPKGDATSPLPGGGLGDMASPLAGNKVTSHSELGDNGAPPEAGASYRRVRAPENRKKEPEGKPDAGAAPASSAPLPPLGVELVRIVRETCRTAKNCDAGRYPDQDRAASILEDLAGLDLAPAAREWSDWVRFRRLPSNHVRDAWASLRKWLVRDRDDGKLRPVAPPRPARTPEPAPVEREEISPEQARANLVRLHEMLSGAGGSNPAGGNGKTSGPSSNVTIDRKSGAPVRAGAVLADALERGKP